jgi:predicted dehydrogenase
MESESAASRLPRRSFLAGTTAAIATTAAVVKSASAANEKIGVGFIGYGLIGKRHVADFRREQDVDLVALAEVHRGRLEEGTAALGGGATSYTDFRKLLDDQRVQAVVVSTPDHWHALMTMLACDAGKDVYVEKPLTLFVREGRWMIDVAARSKRVVQAGTQQRSGKHYQRARELMQSGELGKIHSVRMQAVRNIGQGFGKPPDSEPPPELDYDLWLGPAPKRPYNPLRAIYHFRWFWDYSGGQMTNLGAHHLDIVDWVLGLDRVASVSCIGGRYVNQDRGETPDTQDAIFDCGDYTAAWSLRECSRGGGNPAGIEFFGTKGSLAISRDAFKVTADADMPAESQIPGFEGHPIGGPKTVKTSGSKKLRTEPVGDKSGDSDEQFRGHVRNFLDCIKSRQQPISTLESAHRTATTCHLANLSMRLKRQIHWDAAKETTIGAEEANTHLVRPYRAPWDRELAALGIKT